MRWSPPLRLRALSDRWVPLLRIIWLLCFVMSVAAITLGTVHAMRQTYEVRPVFAALGIDYEIEDSGDLTIKTDSKPGASYRLVAIDGEAVDRHIRIPELGKRLKAARGPEVTLDLVDPQGMAIQLHQTRRSRPVDPAA